MDINEPYKINKQSMNTVIVNADDFGRTLSINEAIDYAFKRGIINRTTIMVTHPFVQDAVNKSIGGGYFDKIGLHLNLCTDNPLTDNIKKYDLFRLDKGTGSFWKSTVNRFVIRDTNLKQALRDEIEAQMKRYVELGFTCMHIDSHRHLHCSPSILAIVIPLAKKYGFKTMRISRNIGELLSIDKKVIKSYVNYKIKRSFDATNLFGGYEDYVYAGCPKTESFEIMVHPDVVNGEYIDVTEGINSNEKRLLSSIIL